MPSCCPSEAGVSASSETRGRRRFLNLAGIAVASAAMPGRARAQARVEESDAQAAALGYRHDTTKVDKAKFPKHTADQVCANCQLYQGKAGDAWGGCTIFPGKQVNAKGWCSAWVKKA
jgi:hypothetical protein